MPNWCMNTLTIVGPQDKVEALVEAVKSDDPKNASALSFNRIIPMPAELVDTTAGHPKDANADELKAKYGFENWYDWSIANWDTKWDVTAQEPDDIPVDEGRLGRQYHFDTAWSPAFKVFETLSEQYPDLYIHLRFEEPGMDFAGSRTYFGGEEVDATDLGGAPSTIDFDAWRVDEYLEG